MANTRNKTPARRRTGPGGHGRSPAVKRVAHVSREFEGLAGAGGIKDVTAGLARASAESGIRTDVFLPCYPEILEQSGLELKEVAATCPWPTPISRTASSR